MMQNELNLKGIDGDAAQRALLNYRLQQRQAWTLGLPHYIKTPLNQSIPIFIAVGSGKGGVGKSLLSANLAASLGRLNLNVLLVDLDFGGANLHTYLGLNLPRHTLTDYLLEDTNNFNDVILSTSLPGVFLAPGGRDESWSSSVLLNQRSTQSLWSGLCQTRSSMGIDLVLIDLGAGTQRYTIDFFTASHLGIVIVLPDPTSIENAYSFLKASMLRFVESVGRRSEDTQTAELVSRALFYDDSNLKRRSFAQKIDLLASSHPQFIANIRKALEAHHIAFVVNQTRSQKDEDIAFSMDSIAQSYFGFNTSSLGHLHFDDAAWKALRNKRLLYRDFPHAPISRGINQITLNILKHLDKNGGA